MDYVPLVNEQIEDGKRLLERLAEEGVSVTAACWLKETERSRWHLHFVSSLMDDKGGRLPAYERVRMLMEQIPQPFWIELAEVRFEKPNGPLGKAMREIVLTSNGKLPMHLSSGSLGGVSIDAAYIYPPISAPVQQV
jgi:hypothetical protein